MGSVRRTDMGSNRRTDMGSNRRTDMGYAVDPFRASPSTNYYPWGYSLAAADLAVRATVPPSC